MKRADLGECSIQVCADEISEIFQSQLGAVELVVDHATFNIGRYACGAEHFLSGFDVDRQCSGCGIVTQLGDCVT